MGVGLTDRTQLGGRDSSVPADPPRRGGVCPLEALCDLEAVKEIPFAHGEVFAFMRPNGAGTTTTTKMLCTLARPTGGTARIGRLRRSASAELGATPHSARVQEQTLDDQLAAVAERTVTDESPRCHDDRDRLRAARIAA